MTRTHIESFKTAVVTGKSARDQKLGRRRRSIVKGGKGALTRTLGFLGAIFGWGLDNGYVRDDPVRGVKRFADAQRKALLTVEQYRALALALDALDTSAVEMMNEFTARSDLPQSDSSRSLGSAAGSASI